MKVLKKKKKITLKPGEEKVVRFTINESLLQFCNSNLEWVVEPGAFQVFVGPNSRDLQMLSFEYQ